MYEQLVHEHQGDLLREAAHRRLVSRADRATPRAAERAARRVRGALSHRPAVAAGCQA